MRGNSASLPITLISWIAVIAVFLVLPFVVGPYLLEVMIMLLINIVVVASFRLITMTGGWSLAHIPLVGVGAYSAALLSKHFGVSFWLNLPLGGLTAAFVAAAICYPLLRMKGFAFFIGSFAAGEAIRLCWIRFRNPFGGPRGLIDIAGVGSLRVAGLFSLNLDSGIPFYFLTVLVTLICLYLMHRLGDSRIGVTLEAIHIHDNLAKSLGIPVTKYRALAFIAGGFFAGVAGAMLAHRLRTIDPHQFGFTTTLYLLLWAIVGGTTTFAGPLLGIVALTAIGELIRRFSEWVPLIYGVILIVVVLFFPQGLESLPARIPFLLKKYGIAQKGKPRK